MLKRRLGLPGGLPDDCPRELHPYDLCCSGVECDIALYPAFGATMGIHKGMCCDKGPWAPCAGEMMTKTYTPVTTSDMIQTSIPDLLVIVDTVSPCG